MRTLRAGVVGVGLLLIAVPLLAHHSFSAEFDIERPITLKGTLTELRWVNPHGWIHMDVKGPDGEVVNWAVELGSPTSLLRRGLRKSDFPPGLEIVVEGMRRRTIRRRPTALPSSFSTGVTFLPARRALGPPSTRARRGSTLELMHVDRVRTWFSRSVRATAAVATASLLLSIPAAGQAPAGTSRAYTPPRTPDGQPDLQGIWQVINTAAWDIQDHPGDWEYPPGKGWWKGMTFPTSRGRWRKSRRTLRTARPQTQNQNVSCPGCHGSRICRIRFRFFSFLIVC